ncbi:hypothetical protein EYD10_08704 [Varanus komodoensis]|nr:hypothetical protein EYD10_08704 [Varanus komodoensis]
MRVKEENAKVGLKLNIKKTKIMASSPLTSWQIDGEEMEVVTDFIFLGSKITADGDCSQEIKRHLLLGRKAMAILDSILKGRDITLPTKVHIVKAMVFPLAMYGYESWTIRKAERRRTDAFAAGRDSCESLGQQDYQTEDIRKTGLESEERVKMGGRYTDKLRYSDDTVLMAEGSYELKQLLMKAKEEIKKEREKRLLSKLKDEEGQLQVQSIHIKKIAEDFFAKLYQNDEFSTEKVNEYIQKGDLPKLPKKYQKVLNQEVTITEVTEAIKRQKNDKTPGPDGLPAEFYKSFEGIFTTLLKDICNAALLNAKIPNTWTEANITLILKEDTDLTQIQNYGPISLLNVDYKMFASIMAERLKKYLTDFIHSDQNGFLPKGQMRNNMRTILDILEYYEIHTEKPMALLFMDAQKAFDNVNWQFMKQQLVQMEFGEKFINAILSIYQKQSARIIINGEFTNIIDIQKGTRQGCPLSPLLFILLLEVLNRNIRDDMDIKGTRIRDESYKLQAFADDLVFITEEPLVTMPKLIQRIEDYGEITGMKINREKTKLLVKNLTQEQRKTLLEQVDLQIVKKVKYLGIYLTAKCTSLKEDNYDKLFKEIKSDLEKWANLQLSLLGRIALAKMNILPKLLFLFQTIPIKIDRKFFDDLNFQILRFIWRKKKPRIKLKILQEAKENGGFGLPDWLLYYQASVLTWLKE